MMTLRGLLLPLVAFGLMAACARDDAARPTTLRELSQQVAVIQCAFDARQDACAYRPALDEINCQSSYVSESCWIAEHGRFNDPDTQDPGACDRPLSADVVSQLPTFEQYEACRAATMDLSCSEVDAKTKPAACENVIK